jgi:hypothetical protein
MASKELLQWNNLAFKLGPTTIPEENQKLFDHYSITK